MERTTIKYIIRSLVILETKWNALLNKIASWLNVPGPLGIVHTDLRILEGPRRLQQQRRCGSSSSDSISRYISSTASRRSTRSSGGSSSGGINRRSRRVAAVAATSAAIVVLSGSCSNGISRRNCYSRIYSIQSQGKPWLLRAGAGAGARVE